MGDGQRLPSPSGHFICTETDSFKMFRGDLRI